MKGLLPFLSLLLLCMACQQKPSRPDNVLAPEKMEPLLWELLQADQFVSSFVTSRDTARSAHATGPQLYQAILKKHGVTDTIFKASLTYYKAHPKQFLPMLDSLSHKPDLAPTALVDSSAATPANPGPPTPPPARNIQRDPRKPAILQAQ